MRLEEEFKNVLLVFCNISAHKIINPAGNKTICGRLCL